MSKIRLFRQMTAQVGVLIALSLFSLSAFAQGAPKPDVNIIGPTKDPLDIRDEGLKQQNEPACAMRPGDGDCIICFYNDYRTVDIFEHKDAWIGMSESCDAGDTWFSRVTPGHPTHPAPIGTKFAADPRAIAVPGMTIHGFIGGFRDQDSGVIALQHWLEVNKEDFDYNEPALETIIVDEGTEGRFIDKPEFHFKMDEGTPQDTIPLSFVMENAELGTIDREFPAGTLYAAYAVFTGSQSVKLLVKRSNDLGKTWTNQVKKLTESQNLVSGITMTSLGNLTMAMWRQVQDTNDMDALYYATTTSGGNRWSKPKLLTEICRFDQPSATIPADPPTTVSALATFRTNDFPWLANDGTNIYAVYTERMGGCVTGTPKVIVQYTSNGNSWDQETLVNDSVESDPSAVGAQFMPAAFGARGKVQVAWYDTRRENVPFTADIPFVADNNFMTGDGTSVNRKVDVYTARITPNGSGIDISPSTRVSRYRTVREPSDSGGPGGPGGPAYEIEASFANAKMYSSGFLAFLGDYLAVTAQEFRLDGNGGWQGNQSPIPGDPNRTNFFVAYADNRDVRGDVLFNGTLGSNSYTPTDNVAASSGADAGQATSGVSEMLADSKTPVTSDDSTERRSTEGIDDVYTDPATGCVPDLDRTRDANIYGAVIRDELRLSTPVASRPLAGISRAIPFLVRDVTTELSPPPKKPYRLYIANQPGTTSPANLNRASFRQLPAVGPFDLTGDPPRLIEDVEISPNSAVALTAFVVSPERTASVNVEIYEGGCAKDADDNDGDFRDCGALGSITLGGGGTAGTLQQPDYVSSLCVDGCDVSVTELHNPLLENPLLENPLLENPLLENPLLENMELENPLLENPLLENVGYANPLLENPLLENPLLENPLLENPLLENPLLENPLLENSAFGGDVTYADITAVIRNDGNVTTAYSVDATVANFNSTGGENNAPVSQLILWKQYATGTSRGCEYRPEVRNQVVATINQPDDLLSKATIDNPFAGEAALILAPGEQGFVTYRLFGNEAEIAAARLSGFTAASQAANCAEFDGDQVGPGPGEDPVEFYACKNALDDGVERILFEVDSVPPEFTSPAPDTTVPLPAVEANAPGGACVDPDSVSGLLTATDNEGAIVTITCVNEEGNEICDAFGAPGLSIPVSSIITDPGPPPVELGPQPIFCTAKDEIGNESESIRLFFDVDDTAPPFFDPPPSDPILPGIADSSGVATVDFENDIAGTGFDEDGVDPNPVIACSPASGSTFSIGPTPVSCTVTDSSGNSSSEAMFTVTVDDVTDPVVTVSAIVTPDADGSGVAIVTYTAIASDNDPLFDPNSVACSPASGSAFSIGSTPVSCTATDPSGNSFENMFTVTIQDNIGPMISDPPDIDAFLDASGTATVTYAAPAVTDNDPDFPPTTASCSPASGSAFSLGETIVTCTATDPSGNPSQVTFTITVGDNTDPMVTVPADITANADEFGEAVVTYTASATDNDPDFSQTTASCSPPSGSTFSIGSTPVTCTATDPTGNTGSESFTVTVVDNTGPSITVSDDIFALIEGPAGADVTFAAPTATDAGGIQSVTCDATSGSTFPPGETIVTCTATDNAGNTSSDSFTVTVGYAGGVGIFANKYNVKGGSSLQLTWAWQDEFGNNIDSSDDDQLLRIVDCDDPNIIVLDMAGDPGSSGFRFKSDNSWEYNWQTDNPDGTPLPRGDYCPSVESDLTGDTLLITPRAVTVR